MHPGRKECSWRESGGKKSSAGKGERRPEDEDGSQERGDRRGHGIPLGAEKRLGEPDGRDAVVDYARYWSDRSSLPATRLVGWIGIGRGTFYQWPCRYGKANEQNAWIPRDFRLEHWERDVIAACVKDHPREG